MRTVHKGSRCVRYIRAHDIYGTHKLTMRTVHNGFRCVRHTQAYAAYGTHVGRGNQVHVATLGVVCTRPVSCYTLKLCREYERYL